MNDKVETGIPIRIGALSIMTGVKIETIRYYEREGILPAPPRSENGYRMYPAPLQRRLRFVKRARELGFTLDQVRDLLALIDTAGYTCGEVQDIATGHLREVRRKIRDLKTMERTLSGMVAQCEGGAVPDCPIIDDLSMSTFSERGSF